MRRTIPNTARSQREVILTLSWAEVHLETRTFRAAAVVISLGLASPVRGTAAKFLRIGDCEFLSTLSTHRIPLFITATVSMFERIAG